MSQLMIQENIKVQNYQLYFILFTIFINSENIERKTLLYSLTKSIFGFGSGI